MKKITPHILYVSIASLGLIAINQDAVFAQVSSDGTVNTQVNQDGNVSEITGGETKGSNLFHSFQDFSVNAGNEAFFNNATDVGNIFSRVTGGNISNIDGAIRANGSANLFLINPVGIIFSEGSSLDIGGSFYGSSASSILFEEGEFNAADLENPPLLTVNAPIGLGFRDNPGDIVNRSTNLGFGLQVSSGETIGLIGGEINFTGGLASAPGGTIELGGLTQAGTISFSDDGSLIFPNGVSKSNVVLSDQASVDITSDGGGLITVNANSLELKEESTLLANIGENLGSEDARAGTIEVNSTSFSAKNNSLLHSDNLGTGQAGTINIASDTIDFSGGSAITASTFGLGDAGTINVTAQNIVIDQEFSGIYSNVGLTRIASESEELNTDGVIGNGGIINVDTGSLLLNDGARIISSSIAQGNGGTININATGEVAYIGQGVTPVPAFGGDADDVVISGSFSQVQQDTGNGNSGTVNITADSLRLIDKGAVLTDNSGVGGDAGDINLDINNRIFIDEIGLILAQVQGEAEGNGGNINIEAGSFETQGGTFILADTKGIGDAGDINIDVRENISLDEGTMILTEVGEDAIGDAGDINIIANSLMINDSSEIVAETNGQGNAGNINITTNQAISIENGGEIRSLVEENATGNGGNISLTSAELNLTDNANITADTEGQSSGRGNISAAGNIDITVSGDINLNNSSQIQSQTRNGAVGNAGNITITTDGSLFSTNGNLILADSQAQGDGGNITINAAEQIVLEGLEENGFPSQIVVGLTREESNGTGGTIEINSSELILRDVAFISSNTTENSIGNAGNITLNVDKLSLSENAFINVFTDNNSNGGEITINSQTVDLFSGGKIFAATDNEGNAGNINLNISDRITLDNSVGSSATPVEFPPISQPLNDIQNEPSGIYANATDNATGNGGNVTIGLISEQIPEDFIISNNAQIIVDSQGTGSGGSIFLQSQNLELDNNTLISASTIFGQGGNITFKIAEDITLDNNSSISARAFNDANGGNLSIDSRFIIAFPEGNNDIIANAARGQGGNIDITAESLLGIQERSLNNSTNDINASSEFSLDGNVNINTPDLNPVQSATELPQNVVEPQETTAQACRADSETSVSNQLIVSGRGGIAPAPGNALNSANVMIDGEVIDSTAVTQPLKTSKGQVQPARGIKVMKSGEVVLTSYTTDNAGNRVPSVLRNCKV